MMTQVKNVKHSGNISMTDVIGIARIMRPRSMSRELSGTIREILGTCQSVGCTVDGEAPHDLIEKVQKKPYALCACSPEALSAVIYCAYWHAPPRISICASRSRAAELSAHFVCFGACRRVVTPTFCYYPFRRSATASLTARTSKRDAPSRCFGRHQS